MNICLGIFDSGVGGFSVLQRILERHGDLPCLYLGDTARVPYGEKTPSEIRNIAREIMHWFSDKEVSAVVIGCNTTNSLALDIVEKSLDIPVFGLINAATNMLHEKRIGVLATPLTAASLAYTQFITSKRPGTFVIEQGCPRLVPLIESGQLDNLEIKQAISQYLSPLIEARVEAIILGCTHYPLIVPLLKTLLPLGVRIIDPAIGLALQLDDFLGSPKALSNNQLTYSMTRFCVTAKSESFSRSASAWLGQCPEIHLVSLKGNQVSSRIGTSRGL